MKRSVIGLLVSLVLVNLSYDIRHSRSGTNVVHADATSTWIRVEAPLTISHDDKLGNAFAQGFWQLTGSRKDTQPISPQTTKIICTRYDRTCGEIRASVPGGVLQADSFNYYVFTWTKDGIVANDFDEGVCGLGHRLSLDFKSNSVTVTDYPKHGSSEKNCQSFQDLKSYALHGGQVALHPPATWKP
jgi:hypothetical protein